MRPLTGNRRRRERGYVLITAAMFALAFIGALGLVVDLGRLYVLKSETQARTDAAALSAAARLDGTLRGLTENPENAHLETEFSTTADGPWSRSREAPQGSRFVRLRTQSSTPGFFSRLITGDASGTVGAAATAGQVEAAGLKGVEFPCASQDLAERLRQDTDRDSKTYEEYAAADRGNGRRIVACASGGGIAGFFVNDETGSKQAIGAFVEGSRRRGAAAQAGYYRVRLVR